MKIRLLSDLHTEFRLPYKTHPMSEYRGEDMLVLAGDIASGSTNTMDVIKFYKQLGFPNIVYVPGNHEYYGTSMEDFDTKMRKGCAELEGVHFLNGDSVVINNVLIVGATLWTNFNNNDFYAVHAAKKFIADFKYIKGFSVEQAIELYNKHFEFIKQQYENRDNKKVVVVTHFLPAQICISPKFKDDNSGLNDYFANRLDSYIAEMQDTTWMFGHTHDPLDTMLVGTRVVCNPHGYYTARDEGQFFEPFKTVEV